MTTHDLLAYSLATEAVSRIRRAEPPWPVLFSPSVHVTSSRAWPMPDFVVTDPTKGISGAAEFKPPDQTKREYLTGLGQACAYSKNFNYAFLIVPDIADDGYRIADHICGVMEQSEFANLPISLWSYDPSVVSPTVGTFTLRRFPAVRTGLPSAPAHLENSFYAKWREASPEELLTYLGHIFDEIRRPSALTGTIRDRAFERVWNDMQAGLLHHWGGEIRNAANTNTNKEAWRKNYRNFLSHIGWLEGSGVLTEAGFQGLRIGTKYDPFSVPFLDYLAKALLLDGKHLVLLRAINDFQESYSRKHGDFDADERPWLDHLETHLEDIGLLKRNPGRAGAAVAGSPRGFFKAEKQIWKNLQLIVPYGPAAKLVYHPRKGLRINWGRITDLIQK